MLCWRVLSRGDINIPPLRSCLVNSGQEVGILYLWMIMVLIRELKETEDHLQLFILASRRSV